MKIQKNILAQFLCIAAIIGRSRERTLSRRFGAEDPTSERESVQSLFNKPETRWDLSILRIVLRT